MSADWLDEPVALAPRVTLVDGADGHPLLFAEDSGTYVRLSATGARLVPLLDGSRTGTALLNAARRARGPGGVHDRAPVLLSFLTDLRRAGVLSVPPEPLRGRDLWIARFFRLTPHLRIPARHLNLMLRPPSAVLARFPRTATALTVLAGAAAVAAIVLALTLPAPLDFVGPPWLVLFAALLVQAAVHEMGHATVCQALGVPVREAGVKLFCFLVPLTYVDRTDAYRVRSRFGRLAVAMVGPMIDIVAAGVCAALIVLDPERFGALRWLLGMQLFVVFNNLNPLFPVTDGHHALEAALGEINLRDRAFRYLGHVFLRMPLPAAHRAVSAARRRIYLVYGLVSTAFVALLLMMISMNYYRLAAHFIF
ncbi:site-2 protease family protein [Actinoplanes siamensis]|uniref:Peptidase M50 domain-containing protein n=1 Tax=Actinoplanes siamensis TaxID=1223317 RepID=A0A919TKN8_9ACTN|nr:site-2 protease family protein [Actinoplanes siamensis]GIF05513.1 hypothetical protein Asi03nite_30510 [Actinoplanes siamensis]